jgi:peptidoglycan-associated lipoprotein
MKTTKLKSVLPVLLCIILLYAIPVKAQYVIKEADAAYELFNYKKAIDLYEQAYQKKESLHAAERLASAYQLIQNYKEAESWYAIAVNMPGNPALNTLNYARALQNNSKYSEARVQYEKYAILNKEVTEAQKTIWLASCDSAVFWMKNPQPVLINNQQNLNSKQSDWGAVVYQNGLVFASDRSNIESTSTKGKRPFLKFDGAKRPDKDIYGWTGNGYLTLYEQKDPKKTTDLFPLHINTDYHVASPVFNNTENELYFTLTRIPKKGTFDKNKIQTINVEIYSSKKDGQGNWSDPVAFKYNKVSEYSVGDPFVTGDGTILYFVSDMPGGKGGMDIYSCQKNANGEWGAPENITELNTEGSERSPAFDEHGDFYFSSDGRIGMGGLDIFKAKFDGQDFREVENIGYPFNSPQDDFALRSSGTEKGYFASNRTDGIGSDDIYSFAKQRILAFKLKGIVYKKGTDEPIDGAVVTLNKIGGGSLKAQTGADGSFKFNLEESSDYGLRGEKTNFSSDSASVTTVGLTYSATIEKDLYLEMITLNKPIRLENIYYNFDKADIRPDAAKELDKLVKLMKENPTMWIELGSHTDSRGNDAYNQLLSQKRANSAVQYIIDQGISKNRITAKGYGESQLLNRCANGVNCSDAEHQQNRRTEFKIVKN